MMLLLNGLAVIGCLFIVEAFGRLLSRHVTEIGWKELRKDHYFNIIAGSTLLAATFMGFCATRVYQALTQEFMAYVNPVPIVIFLTALGLSSVTFYMNAIGLKSPWKWWAYIGIGIGWTAFSGYWEFI